MKNLFNFILIFVITFSQIRSEEPKLDLNKIENALKAKPDDPMLHYKKCQALFAMGKEQESVDHAKIALEKFIKAKVDLARMNLGTIKTDKYKIDVDYNMGSKERAENKEGIVRPFSFRVWTINNEPKLIRVLDFELAYFKGELMSAAIGEMKDGTHINFGIIDAKSSFETIKKNVLEIVAK